MGIAAIRLSKNMTQIELADKLGVSRTTVTMWETNRSVPNAIMLKKIAQALDCTVDDLLKENSDKED